MSVTWKELVDRCVTCDSVLLQEDIDAYRAEGGSGMPALCDDCAEREAFENKITKREAVMSDESVGQSRTRQRPFWFRGGGWELETEDQGMSWRPVLRNVVVTGVPRDDVAIWFGEDRVDVLNETEEDAFGAGLLATLHTPPASLPLDALRGWLLTTLALVRPEMVGPDALMVYTCWLQCHIMAWRADERLVDVVGRLRP